MKQKGFTLIELLMVISIVALLASIVLASLNTAREKGRIGSAHYFAAQVDHIAGEQAVGIWDFDECSGTTVADRSGFGNTGTFVNSPVWVSGNTPSGRGCSIDFSGGSKYVTIPDSASLDLTTDFTVSFWVYMKVVTNNIFMLKGDDTVFGAAPSFGFGGNGFMFIANNSSNSPFDARYGSDDNRWHQFVGVATGGSTRTLYIDGKLVGSFSAGNHSWNNSSPLQIGRGGSYTSNSIIDEVRVYAKTLTAQEIDELYAKESSAYAVASNMP